METPGLNSNIKGDITEGVDREVRNANTDAVCRQYKRTPENVVKARLLSELEGFARRISSSMELNGPLRDREPQMSQIKELIRTSILSKNIDD